MARGRGRRRVWTRRALRIVSSGMFLLLVLCAATQSASAAELTPGRSPFSLGEQLLSRLLRDAERFMASPASLPTQGRGSGSPGHSTRADAGSGRAPGNGAGQVPTTSPAARKSAGGKSAAAVKGFDAKTSKRLPAKSSAYTTWWQNADGTQTEQISQTVVNYKDSSGGWAPIVTALKQGSDGRWQVSAAGYGLSLAAGSAVGTAQAQGLALSPDTGLGATSFGASDLTGSARMEQADTSVSDTDSSTGTLATLTVGSGESVAWSLAGAASVTPTESGDTVTYPSILTDTDLSLSSEDSGIKESLVLSSASAPNSWTFPLTLTGLSLSQASDGTWQLVDSSGNVAATLAEPFALDSSNTAAAETQAVTYSLATVDGVEQLTMTLSQSWLDDPARVFPVTVDPTITVSTADSGLSSYVDGYISPDGTVNDQTKNYSSTGVLNVGYDGTDTDRSYINFPSATISSDLQDTGYHVTAAQFAAYMASGSTSASYPFDVYSVADPWSASSIDYANAPTSAYEELGSYAGSTSSAATCTGLSSGYWLYTPLSATAMDTFALNEATWYGVMLWAHDETSTAYYRAFGSASNSACSPYISLTYTPDVAPTVSTMSPATGSVVSSLTPELTASGTDSDDWPNSSVEYEFLVYDASGGTAIAHSALLSSGSWTVPKGTLKWGNTYQWSVCVWDGFKCGTETLNAFETTAPGPVLTQDLSQSTSGHGFDVATGNYTTSVTDANIAGVGPALDVERDYNSLDTRKSGGFGAGWSSMVDVNATQELYASGALQAAAVTYPDGSVEVFGYNSDGSYSPPEGTFATLLPITSSGSVVGYTLTDKTGTAYTFGHVSTAPVAGSTSGTFTTAGVFGISQVADHAKHTLTFLWGVSNGVSGSHVLVETSAPSGRALSFTWQTPSGAEYPHVAVVTTSYANSGDATSAQYWSYTYSGDMLSTMCAPDPSAPATASSACTTYSYQLGSDYQQATVDTAPYQYWPMDDATGYSSSLTQVGANIGIGRANYTNMTGDTVFPAGPMAKIGSEATGAVFNGSDSFMTLPTGMVLNTTYVSVGLWFKTTSSGPLFTEQNADIALTPTNATMSLYVGTDGYLRGGWYTGVNGSAGQIEDTKAKVTDGAWHYAVLAGAGATQTLYVDGASVGSLSGTVENLGQTYEYVGAGYSSGTWPDQAAAGKWYFKGSISDVSVYRSAVPSTQVANLYAVANTSVDWLNQITRPRLQDGISSDSGEAPAAAVVYNEVDGRVTSVTDGNGAVWGLSDPTVSGSSQVFRETVMGDRPAFYYRLNDAAGSKYAADEVNADAWANAGLAATYSGVTLGTTSSVFGDTDAGTFDGSSSYMQLPTGLTASAPVSIALWFQTKSSGPLFSEQDQGLASVSPPSAATNALYVGTNGLLYGSFAMGTQTAIASKDKVTDGGWHYVVLTASATSESMYLDGALVGSESGTYTYAGQDEDLIGAGYSSGDWPNQGAKGDWYFNGSISDAAFFYSQLSSDQATQLWQGYQNTIGFLIPLESVTVTDPANSVDSADGVDVTRTETYDFDPAHDNREVKYVNGLGDATTYSYDTDGFLDVVTDPNGDQTITGHDVRGNVVSTTTCQYQALNKCSTSYETYYPDDTTTSFTASTLDPRDDMVLTSSDGRSASAGDSTYQTTYTYDGDGNVLTKKNPAGNGVTNVYSTATSQHACAPDPTPATLGTLSTTQYEPTDLLSTSTTTGGAVTRYVYYPDGDTCMVENADHLATYYTYDGLGRVLTKTVEGGDSILANMVGYAGTLTTSYVYDGLGRVVQTTAPAVTDAVTGVVHTAVTVQTFDADGGLTSTTVSDSKEGGDYSREQTYTYNQYDQKASYTSADGNPSTDPATKVTVAGASGHTAHYTYDAWGNVETQTDELTGAATRTVKTLYNAADQLVTTELLNTGTTDGTYSAGSILTTDTKTYDPGGRLASDEDALHYFTCYYYYDNNLLYQEVKSSGSCPASVIASGAGTVSGTQVVETNLYDGAGNVTTKYTNNGVTETDDVYHADGTLATTAVDPGGVDRITGYTYSADGYVTETVGESKAGGVVSVVSDVKETYDGLGDVMTKTVVDGTESYETIYTLDQRGLPTQVQDPDGNITYATYDADGRLVATTSATAVSVTLWCQTATSYSACTTAGTAVTMSYIPTAETGYDTFGDVVESEAPHAATGASAASSSTVTTYDAEGNKTSVTLPTYTAPGASAPTASTTTYQYDADGELTTQTDPIAVASSNANGEQVTDTYTMLGTVASQTSTDLAAGTSATTTYTYDADGDRLSTNTPISSSRSVTTGATYDYLGRTLTSSTTESDPTDGTTAATTYTASDVYGTGGWLATTTSPDKDTETYGYDNVGEKTTATDILSNTTTYGYDGAGRQTTTTLPDKSSSQIVYDEAGNETSTATYSSAGTQLSGTSMAYDGDGLLTSSTAETPGQAAYSSADTETTTYSYDATGLLAKEVAPLTGSSTVPIYYTYDPAGNQSSYTDGDGNTTYSSYNPWNLAEDQVVPTTSTDTTLASRTTTTSYDADGQPTLVSEPVATATSAPITETSAYNGFGDLTSQTGAGAEGLNTTRTFSYDLTGLPTTASTQNAAGTQLTAESYSYDDRGDLVGTSGAAGSSNFAYNGDGQMLSRTDASGTTSYGYNTDDQLTSLTDAATGTDLGYSYNDLDQVSKITYGTGDTRSFGYNSAHEVTGDTLKTSSSGTTVDGLTYSWDTDGDMLSKTDTAGTANTYTYDASGRLATWSNGTKLTNYSYDADSNRTGITTTTTASGAVTGDETLTYDARDELTGTTDSVTTASSSYNYTPRGTTSQDSTVSATGATGTTTYEDDAFGQQTSTGNSTYTYDASGRLTSTVDGAATTSLQYSGTGNDVASDGTNTYSRDPEGDLIGTADTAAGTSGLLWTDLHTDVVGEFAAAGTALSGTETYNPLGAATTDTGTTSKLTVGYQSEFTDAATGAVNMASRWYNPASGQFTSKDTVDNSAVPNTANANPFAYADGNPMTGTDPTGHMMQGPAGQECGNATSCAFAAKQGDRIEAQEGQYDYQLAVTNAYQGCRGGMCAVHAAQQLQSNPNYVEQHYQAALRQRAYQAWQQWASAKPTVVHEKCGITHIGGCIHDAAVVIGQSALATDAVSFVAGVATALVCGAATEVETGGASTPACMAAAFAVGNSVSYALSSTANGTFSWAGLGESAAVGAISGAAVALTGGAILGAAGSGTVGMIAAGAGSGLVGGGLAGGGNYLIGCGTSCSASGFFTASAESGALGMTIGAFSAGAGSAFGSAVDSSFGAADDAPVADVGSATDTDVATAAAADTAPTGSAAEPDTAAPAATESEPSSGGSCAHSFTGATAVLMADGTTKPIDQIKVGDKIENSAPGKSGTQTHKVDAVIVTHTDHDFVDVTVKPATTTGVGGKLAKLAKTAVALAAAATLLTGVHTPTITGTPTAQAKSTVATSTTATLTTTYHHPFYDETQGAFVQAQYLKPGDRLQTPTGTTQITDIHLYHANTTTYDLTIDGLHTFYVVAGDTPVLVHNCGSFTKEYPGGSTVMATVNSDGAMEMAIQAEDGSVKGGQMFRDAMDALGPENVNSFEAKWVRAMPSNLDAFNANLRAGMSYEEAAANTFTGHMLAGYGLTDVTVDPSTLVGEFGNYTNAEPIFSRPAG